MPQRLLSFYLKFGISAAISYAIPLAVFFIRRTQFSDIWLLYLGNILQTIVIMIAVIQFNRALGNNVSLQSLILGGMKVHAVAIATAVIIALLMLLFDRHRTVINAPANTVRYDPGQLWYIVLLNAIMVNVMAGAFGGFIVAISAKRNQKTETGVRQS